MHLIVMLIRSGQASSKSRWREYGHRLTPGFRSSPGWWGDPWKAGEVYPCSAGDARFSIHGRGV